MASMYFALRSGSEDQNLQSFPCQITIVENNGSVPYLHYQEDILENNQDGLNQMCLDVRIEGLKTNHSLCATAAI